MAKSIKLKNNTFIDSSGIIYNHTLLSNLIPTHIKTEIIDSGNNPNVTKTYTINYRLCLLFMYNTWGNCGLYLLDKRYNGGSYILIRTISDCSLATLSSDNVNTLKIQWGQISSISIIVPILE